MTPATCPLPDFEIVEPDCRRNPVVFNSPHSGADYPADFIAVSKLDAHQLRMSEDCHVDELFACVSDLGSPLLKANFPRAFLDVNRAPWELDPAMFSDTLPDYVETSGARVAGGLGTIPRKVSDKLEIYHEPMSFSQARARVERYYFTYHEALKQLLEKNLAHFGTAILIDCHSMPSSALETARWRRPNVDIVLGDRYGSSCDRQICDLLQDLLDGAGLRVERNKPYAGGYITQFYGKPRRKVHVIQLEINRKVYMNERTLQRRKSFEPLKSVLTSVMAAFTERFAQTDSTALAAE